MMLIPHLHYLQKGPLDLIETGKGLKVQTDKPHLVSLGSGRLSTAITLLPLEEDQFRNQEESTETGEHMAPGNHCGQEERGPPPGQRLAWEKVLVEMERWQWGQTS
eukprot:bmy_03265T0